MYRRENTPSSQKRNPRAPQLSYVVVVDVVVDVEDEVVVVVLVDVVVTNVACVVHLQPVDI